MGQRNRNRNKNKNQTNKKSEPNTDAKSEGAKQDYAKQEATTSNKSSNNNQMKTDKTGGGNRKSGRQDRKDSQPVNDPSWYDLSAAITNQVANIPWSMFVGRTYDVYNSEMCSALAGTTLNAVQPGVILYNYLPWYGDASSPVSALRVTTRAFFQFVRHKNAGRTNYEAADLMLYIMAMDNVYLAIAEVKRILRLSNTFAFNNRNLSKVIMKAMFIDHDDISRNYSNYLARLNILIAKINTMAVPSSFKLFLRRQAMALSVFSDDGENPTQIIIPQATAWFRFNFNDLDHSQSSSLTPVYKDQFGPNNATTSANPISYATYPTLSSYLDRIEDMIARIMDDEDMNIMSGDILKAYGPENLYHINFMENNEVQEVVYDELFVNQFRNSDTLDLAHCKFIVKGTATAPVVYFKAPKGTNDQFIDTEPFIGQYAGNISCSLIIDRSIATPSVIGERCGPTTVMLFKEKIVSWDRVLTPAETIEATRLSLAHEKIDTTSIYKIQAGTEIGLGWQVVEHSTYTNDTENIVVAQWFQRGKVGAVQASVPAGATPGGIAFYSNVLTSGNTNYQFSHATMVSLNSNPFFSAFATFGSGNKPTVLPSMYGGRSYTAFIAQSVLKSMTDAAINALLYSEFVKV